MNRSFLAAAAAILLLAVPIASAQDHDHSEHDHSDHGAMTQEQMEMLVDQNANVVAVGSLDLRVEPMLDLDGRFAVAVSVLHESLPTTAPVRGVLVTPAGERVSFAVGGAMVVTDVVPFAPGVYSVEGTVGNEPFAVEMMAQTAAGDLGSELVMFLVPRPMGPTPTAAHLVVYAFAEGENIHQRFALTRAMPAMEHADADEEFLMMHSHFVHVPLADVRGEETFDPMSNEVTVVFGMAGEWIVDVVIGTGFSAERASFDVTIGGQ